MELKNENSIFQAVSICTIRPRQISNKTVQLIVFVGSEIAYSVWPPLFIILWYTLLKAALRLGL